MAPGYLKSLRPTAASFGSHLEVAAPIFRRLEELVTLSSVHIYGEPHEKALEQAPAKPRPLGGGAVVRAPTSRFHAHGSLGQLIFRPAARPLIARRSHF